MKERARLAISLAVVVLLMLASLAVGSEKEIHAAWLEFVQPALNPQDYSNSFYYHRARENAISVLSKSVDIKDASLLEALGYFQLRDFQYHKAEDSFKAASKHNSKDPLLRYFLANISAILLAAEPAKIQEQSKTAVDEFRRLAQLDPTNALPPLQGASVAFDAERLDLALPLVDEALSKQSYLLYRLPLPEDLTPDPAQSATAWWWAQSELWAEMIARTSNCARGLLRQSDRLALKGETTEANKLTRQAQEIGPLLTRTDPALAMGAASGLEIQAQALQALLLRNPEQEPQLRAEVTKIKSAQDELKQEWMKLMKKETKEPPTSVQMRLQNQKALVETVLSSP